MKLVGIKEFNRDGITALAEMPLSFPDHKVVAVWMEVDGRDAEFYNPFTGESVEMADPNSNDQLDEWAEVFQAVYSTPEFQQASSLP